MQIKWGIESEYEGKAIAWALDFPGCFAYGKDEEEALLRAPQAFIAYQDWVNKKAGTDSWLADIRDFDIRLVESFHNYFVNDHYDRVEKDGYLIMSWFQNDWLPINRIDVLHAMNMLDWNREDLLNLVDQLSDKQLNRTYPNERWSIAGVLKHIGGAEWWYMDRLGLGGMTKAALPSDPFERLTKVRQRLKEILPELAGEEMVRGKEAEFWSPRKLLRRALWHEKDHIIHIQKLLDIQE